MDKSKDLETWQRLGEVIRNQVTRANQMAQEVANLEAVSQATESQIRAAALEIAVSEKAMAAATAQETRARVWDQIEAARRASKWQVKT